MAYAAKDWTDRKVNVSELMAQGYAVISRKFGHVSRIDRQDWKKWCHENNQPVDADFYRRILSADVLILKPHTALKLPNSGDARYTYRPKFAEGD